MRKLLLVLIILWPCYGAFALEGFLKQSTATTVTVTMVSTTDGYSGKTGLTLTIWAIKNGSGAGAAITPTVTEVSSGSAPGVYALALTTGHTNTLGELHLYVTGTGAIPTDCKWEVSTYLPGEAATLQADQAVNATKWAGGTIPSPNVTGVPLVDVKYWLGTIVSTPTVAGVPNVNAKTWNDLATVALPLVPTVAGRTLDVSTGGEAGLDWANIGSPTSTVGLTNTTVGILTTYTGNTPQTGDSYARIGSAGAGLTAIFANNTVDSTGGGLTAGNALMYLMSAVFNTAPQTAGTDDVLALKKFDGTTALATQTIAGAGTGRNTTIP